MSTKKTPNFDRIKQKYMFNYIYILKLGNQQRIKDL